MTRSNRRRLLLPVILIAVLLAAVVSRSQTTRPGARPLSPPPPPPAPQYIGSSRIPDSVILPSGTVSPTIPRNYEDYAGQEYAADLETPENIKTTAEYDPGLGMYVIRTKVGDREIVTPYLMTTEQYDNWQLRKSLQDYYRQRNSVAAEDKDKQPFNILDMNFALGPLEKIFGPGGVQLRTQGSVQVAMGIKSNFTDNPALSLGSRRKTYFDFDQKVQATVNASVGNRLKFNMTYNTDATFDFDSKNLKLAYEGKEDEIIKNIEAGNVSMTTGSSLIRGGTALFGVKAKLQFGKLTVTGLVSQQNSESKTISSQGGVQTTKFQVRADEYDANRHFFLAQYFYDNYDSFASRLPHVSSGINITRIEVWVTNKNSNYNESRNFVGFMDIGENTRLASDYWQPDMSYMNPSNQSNPSGPTASPADATSRRWRARACSTPANTRSTPPWDTSR